MRRIYMDYQATTPLDPRVLESMMPFLTERFGNAASRDHAFGWEADEAVGLARGAVARALGADPAELVFTSGATEAINLALVGVTEAYRARGRHVVTLATEHQATLDTCRALERRGCEVTYLPVDGEGLVDLAVLDAALRPDTVALSVLHGNNEIGVVQDIAAIGPLAKAKGVLFHVDAAQTFGKLPIDVGAMGIDLLSLSGHKLYGPKGIGALYVRRRDPRVKLEPLLHGGGQERGLRPGTLNVPAIVGLGRATELALEEMESEAARLAGLRDRLREHLMGALDGVLLNGHPTRRLPGNLNLTFAFVTAQALMGQLRGIAVSSGAACSSASLAPSHVLKAIGRTDEEARASIRFGLGRFTTAEEVEIVADAVVRAVRSLREASPLYQLASEGIDITAAQGEKPAL